MSNQNYARYTADIGPSHQIVMRDGVDMTVRQVVEELNALDREVSRLRGIIHNPSGKPYVTIAAKD